MFRTKYSGQIPKGPKYAKFKYAQNAKIYIKKKKKKKINECSWTEKITNIYHDGLVCVPNLFASRFLAQSTMTKWPTFVHYLSFVLQSLLWDISGQLLGCRGAISARPGLGNTTAGMEATTHKFFFFLCQTLISWLRKFLQYILFLTDPVQPGLFYKNLRH